jgi:hypothetical protein
MGDDIQDKGKNKIPHVFDLDRDLVQYHFPDEEFPFKRPSKTSIPAERRCVGPCGYCRTHKVPCYFPESIGQPCPRCRKRKRVCSYETSPEENDTHSNEDSAPGEQHRELRTSRKFTKANTQDVDA